MSSFEQNTAVDHAAAKIVSVWALWGFTSWADIAAFLAAVYSLILIGEWVWKKFGRPFLEARGWISRKSRRAADRP